MTEAWRLYQLYARIYNILVCWLTTYLPEQDAKRTVRYALADGYRWACNAVPSMYGPFGDVAEACMARALGMDVRKDAEGWEWPMSSLPCMDVDFHHEVAMLYAAVYAAVFEAGFSITEREQVYQIIRIHDPEMTESTPQAGDLAVRFASFPALRRVFVSMAEHKCDGRLVCTISEQIWREETRRGVAWMGAHMSREAIAPWPGLGS